jgi:hypothetical protein
VGFAEPAGGEFDDVESAESIGVLGGDGIDDGARGVGGTVVDGDDLQIGVVLGQERVECSGDIGSFVASGNDDGDGGVADGRSVVLRKEEVGDARQPAGGGDGLPEPGESDKPGEEGEGEL